MTSWLKSLETVLEKVDSTAKELKQAVPNAPIQSGSTKSNQNGSYNSSIETKSYTQDEYYGSSFSYDGLKSSHVNMSANAPYTSPLRNSATFTSSPSRQSVIPSKSVEDKDIFEFLNGPLEEAKKERQKTSRKPVPRASDTETVEIATPESKEANGIEQSTTPRDRTSAESQPAEELAESKPLVTQSEVIQLSPREQATIANETLPSNQETSTSDPVSSRENGHNIADENDKLSDQVADLQLENKLLRSEIISLNQELTSLTTRTKATQQEFERLSFTIQDAQRVIFEKDKLLGKMKRNEEEFDMALGSKNSQIAALQVKLEEAHQDIRNREEKLHAFQEKMDRLINDKESTVEAHMQSKQLIRQKIEQLEKSVRDEEEAHNSTKQQAQHRERELEMNISEMTKALALTQRSLEDKSSELMKLQIQSKEMQDSNKSMKQDLTEYKLRATKVLQEKEKTIKELTAQLSGSPNAKQEVSIAEYIQLQQERDSLKEEREELKQTIEQLRSNLAESQSQMEAEIEVFQTQQRESDENVQKEQKRVQSLQVELLLKSQEIASVRDDMDKKLDSIQSTLKSREEEVHKLKRQLQVKALSSSSQEELESRLQSITEHLIQKQHQLETIASEKAYLQLQIENLLQKEEKRAKRDDKHTIVIDDDEGFDSPLSHHHLTNSALKKKKQGTRVRPISSLVEQHAPYVARHQVIARPVVGAANFLDSVSTITGKYLRTAPLARLGVFTYMLILHLWVFYIFWAWNPEIHGTSSLATGLPSDRPTPPNPLAPDNLPQ